jgi:hypothetical protein
MVTLAGMFIERRKVETTADHNNLSDAELIALLKDEVGADVGEAPIHPKGGH